MFLESEPLSYFLSFPSLLFTQIISPGFISEMSIANFLPDVIHVIMNITSNNHIMLITSALISGVWERIQGGL